MLYQEIICLKLLFTKEHIKSLVVGFNNAVDCVPDGDDGGLGVVDGGLGGYDGGLVGYYVSDGGPGSVERGSGGVVIQSEVELIVDVFFKLCTDLKILCLSPNAVTPKSAYSFLSSSRRSEM